MQSTLLTSPPRLSYLVIAMRRAYCYSLLAGTLAIITTFNSAHAETGESSVLAEDVVVTTDIKPALEKVEEAIDATLTETNDVSSEVITTEDVTASDSRSIIASPPAPDFSAKTQASYTPNPKQQTSLERLKTYYQAKPKAMLENTANSLALNTQPMCQGTWVYPTNQYQHRNVLENVDKDIPNNQQPLYADADYGYYDSESYVELAGNVVVTQGQQQVSADKVVVNLQDGIAAAQGNVLLLDVTDYTLDENKPINPEKPKSIGVKGGLITIADEVAYQTSDSKATIKDVAFASVPLQAHGYAKQINRVDEANYEAQEVTFTTCPPDKTIWKINAKQIDVNADTGRGDAYNATFKIKDVPILYLPYFNFPIDARRTSGVLLPQAGFSSDGGLTVKIPYYFNLAPNYDATITPNIYSNRNPMLTGEFRYLTKDYGRGDLTASYLPSDRKYQHKDRSSIFFNHSWQSKDYPTLSANATYQYVSDSAYFNDFDNLGLANSQLNLPRRLQADYYDENFNVSAKIETFQTLDKDITNNQIVLDKDKPYSRLPQLSVNYRLPWLKPFTVTGTSDFAYFKRPIRDNSAPEQSGVRLYNKINATYPIEKPWGYLHPTVSLQHIYTQYDEETVLANSINDENKSQSVFVPQFSLDAGLNFYKAGSPLGKFDDTLGGYQLINPRIKYVYSPYKNQTNVPNFNTRTASLNLPQLFEDSWFLGYDRLPDNNHITPAINYRYIDAEGLTRIDGSIGQQFYFDDIRVRLDNSDVPLKLNSSGTVIQLSSQPRKNFWLDIESTITDGGDLSYLNTQFSYQKDRRSLFNVGFIERKEDKLTAQKAFSAITASAIFPLNNEWQFLGSVQYDTKNHRYPDVLLGLNYESCCYGFSIYGRSYHNDLDSKAKSNRAIMAEVNLSGITNRRGGRLSHIMNERMLRYNQLSRF